MAPNLKVLTLNTWMLRLPFGFDIAQDIDERAETLPRTAAALEPDVICLQEVWDPVIRRTFRQKFFELGFHYCAERFDSVVNVRVQQMEQALRLSYGGVGYLAFSAFHTFVALMRKFMGNGLQIYSRYPFAGPAKQMVFSVFTRPDEVMVPKGAIQVPVFVPNVGAVDVYNAHFGAVTFDPAQKGFDPDESLRRSTQVEEFCRWFRSSGQNELAVVGCDLNVHPKIFHKGSYQDAYTDEYNAFVDEKSLGLFDSFGHLAGKDREGLTDASSNRYKESGLFSNSPDARLDYIFSSPELLPVGSSVVLDERDSVHSDHYGVLSRFERI